MAMREGVTAERETAASLYFLDELLGDFRPLDFGVRLWDGTLWRPGGGRAAEARSGAEAGPADNLAVLPRSFVLRLQHPGSLYRMFSSRDDLKMGEAFIYNDFDVEGDIEGVFAVAERLQQEKLSNGRKLRLLSLLHKLPRGEGTASDAASLIRPHLRGSKHSPQRDQEAVTYHYNVSNDFFRLFLDRNLVYSCAYFHSPEDSLDQAQENKLDYICRKLRLKPGDKLLDLGCGWGGLVLHAARNYGARALGITLSEPQAELAAQRIREAGLEDRCRVEVRDYRALEREGRFDKLVSVGMVEHVGEAMLPEYFRHAWRLLRPGGAFLNHGIARSSLLPQKTSGFVDAYVFPDGELCPISTTLRVAEAAGFEVRDVESLREHYALTLRRWVRRLEEQAERARAIAGDVTYRIWRLYMAGSAYRFGRGWLNLYQALLVKPDQGRSGLPLTRADWYGGE